MDDSNLSLSLETKELHRHESEMEPLDVKAGV
jgi:hypothetical protein